MGITAQVGDVFLIPIDDGRNGVGQVVANWKGELYIAVYDLALSDPIVDARIVLGQTPLFVALSLDAKLWHGHWPIIGNVHESVSRIPQPVFKVFVEGVTYVESRDRSLLRPASRDEAEGLRFRNVVAPVRLQNALNAHFGLGEWLSQYDDLRFEYALESSKIVK